MNIKTIKIVIFTAAIYLQINPALAEMDHGDMQMQGGSAPADARDPHAYADGNTLTVGAYVRTGSPPLKLADEHTFWSVMGERFEYQKDDDITLFDLQAWYGKTYNRFLVKTEGELHKGRLEESSTDLLWSHAVSAYFNTQIGLRLDQFDEGQNQQWLAFGLAGLAPYWFELDMTAYLEIDGQTALSAEAEYELLLTQKLILQPQGGLTLYGKNDPEHGAGSGLSNITLGLRLRYEYTRQFAPYIGVEWINTYGNTAGFRRDAGLSRSNSQMVAGLRFWF